LLITQLITVPLATLALATAGGGSCSAPAPQLAFKPTISSIKFNISESAGSLTELHGAQGGMVLGMAADPLYYEYQNQYTMYEQENGKICVALDTTLMYFRARPIVFISNEFPRDTCEFNAILQHEKKHVKALKRFHAKYAKRFKKKMEDIIAQARPVAVDSSQVTAMQEKMQKDMEDKVKAYLEKIMPLLAREQNKIDSPAEYERVDAECDGWNQRLRLE
jgi:hypothetical protein